MDPATYHVLYIYSSMTAFINIAFSQCNFSEGNELNTLSTVAVAFDLLNGSGKYPESHSLCFEPISNTCMSGSS
jgi:hypothetical protein